MRKRELDQRVDNIVYDARNSTSLREEVECLLKKLDASRRLNTILYKAVLVGEEQLAGQILVEYIVKDITQMRCALTRAEKEGIKC